MTGYELYRQPGVDEVSAALAGSAPLSGWAGRAVLAYAVAGGLGLRGEPLTADQRSQAMWALGYGGAPVDVRLDVMAVLDVAPPAGVPGDGRRLTCLSRGVGGPTQ